MVTWFRLGLVTAAFLAACDPSPREPQVAEVRIDPTSAPSSTSAAVPSTRASVSTCPLEAEDACRGACEGGDAESCARWGVVRGRRGEATEELLKLFIDACDRRSGRACNGAGYLLENGIGGKHNLDRSLKLYQRAADLGYAPGHYNIGQRYRDGVGVTPDSETACRAYDAGCNAGDPDGCFMVAAMFKVGACVGGADRVDVLMEKACTMPTEERLRHREAACALVERGR